MALTSVFCWLDYSEQDRREMLKAVDTLAEHEVRDELGLGPVRDAVAELLFPGTSTLQTRARYFLFIPWLYLGLEGRQQRRGPAQRAVRQQLRERESGLIAALKASEPPASGIIGQVAGERLQRFPSSIYWSGLWAWRIRTYPFSQQQYHHALETQAPPPRAARGDDGLTLEAGEGNWHSGLPTAPANFPARAEFALTALEAQYLQERIQGACRDSLLAVLVDLPEADRQAPFPWVHARRQCFGAKLTELLDHARLFSEVMHGAQLLYNLLLARIAGSAELQERYRALLQDWAQRPELLGEEARQWDIGRFWVLLQSRGARVGSTRQFAEAWWQLVRELPDPTRLADDPAAETLLRQREWQIKRRQARLYSGRFSGAAGTGQLDYRWRVARTLAADILDGLAAGAADA